jgi:ethanolamine utilization protein EutP (predicted NTPase)
MKLQADNINGVYQVEDFEGEILNQQEFYDSLSTNSDDSVICAEVDAVMAEKIEAEYGIRSFI